MKRWVPFRRWSNGVITGAGQIEAKQIPDKLSEYRGAAAAIMKATGAAHVLYGIKDYDSNGEIKMFQLYLEQMDDQKFNAFAENTGNSMVYALHRHE